MSIGDSIFLGCVFLGTVTLYIYTRDRWSWRKIILRPLLALIGLCCLVGAGVWAKNAYDNRVVPMHSYLGINLGETKADVKFKKGEPGENLEQHLWGYVDSKGQWETIVSFKDDKVKGILYNNECTYCNEIFGIHIGTTYDELIERLGKPSDVFTSKDGLTRWLSFGKLNLAFALSKGKVTTMGVYDGSRGPIELGR